MRNLLLSEDPFDDVGPSAVEFETLLSSLRTRQKQSLANRIKRAVGILEQTNIQEIRRVIDVGTGKFGLEVITDLLPNVEIYGVESQDFVVNELSLNEMPRMVALQDVPRDGTPTLYFLSYVLHHMPSIDIQNTFESLAQLATPSDYLIIVEDFTGLVLGQNSMCKQCTTLTSDWNAESDRCRLMILRFNDAWSNRFIYESSMRLEYSFESADTWSSMCADAGISDLRILIEGVSHVRPHGVPSQVLSGRWI